MLRPFRLHEPTTVEEATSLLADLGGAARPYAGGTELLLAMKAGVLAYDHLVNVKTVAGLDGIALDGGRAFWRVVEAGAVGEVLDRVEPELGHGVGGLAWLLPHVHHVHDVAPILLGYASKARSPRTRVNASHQFRGG